MQQEQRDRFWEEIKGCIEARANKMRVLVIGDVNASVGEGVFCQYPKRCAKDCLGSRGTFGSSDAIAEYEGPT